MRRSTILQALAASALALALPGCQPEWEEEVLLPDEPPLATLESPATYVGGSALLPNPASVCWVVGPGTSPITQATLDSIQATINEWSEGHTSLRFNFSSNLAAFTSLTLDGKTYKTNCTRDAIGNFQQTLRLYVDHQNYPDKSTPYPDSLTIPGCTAAEGVGTQLKDNWGNPVKDPTTGYYKASVYLWSTFPGDLTSIKTCLYTTHLFTGQPRNNYLHEIGHSLGLSHEQVRDDATCLATPPQPQGIVKVTNYDRDSVMHYVITCQDGTTTVGNFGSTGTSPSDKLAVEVLYPKWSNAGMLGHTVGWVGGNNLDAISDWEARGAIASGTQRVLSNFQWKLNGVLFSTGTRPSATEWAGVGAGKYTLTLQFTDHWSRQYSGSITLEVLASRAEFEQRAAAMTSPSLL